MTPQRQKLVLHGAMLMAAVSISYILWYLYKNGDAMSGGDDAEAPPAAAAPQPAVPPPAPEPITVTTSQQSAKGMSGGKG